MRNLWLRYRWLLSSALLSVVVAAVFWQVRAHKPAIATTESVGTTLVLPTERPIAELPTSISTPLRLPPTNTVLPTRTNLVLVTPEETVTPAFTATSTATSRPFATLDAALPTPPTAVPTPVPPLARSADIINILLLGNDVPWAQGGRTDSIIVVSLNQKTKTVTMLSIPRDLYVYIPGWTMTRINLALPHGHGSEYPGGGGALIKDTILYNLGIPIDYYARIGFEGFKQVIDALGGVEIVVNCALRDWRLISPELDPAIEENWAQFTLEPGVHTMDADLALWYVRSRRTTNDFERGRRQQQLLRGLLNQGIEPGLITRAPALWAEFQDSLETDMDLPFVLQLAPLLSTVRENGVQHLYLAGETVRPWPVPVTGEAVQLLQWEQAQPLLARLMRPPVLNRATRPPITVEVVTSDSTLYRQVADNLAWYGFVPVHSDNDGATPARTHIAYYAPNFKASFDWLLSWLFNQDASEIELVVDRAASEYEYRVILGNDYNSCLQQVEAPYRDPEEP